MHLLTSTTVLVCSASPTLVKSWVSAIGDTVRIVQAHDCEQALERALLDPGVVLVLLDSNWLPFDGARLIKHLRSDSKPRLAQMPIFLLEQSGQSASVDFWLREGADGLLSGRRETCGITALLRRLSVTAAHSAGIELQPGPAPDLVSPQTGKSRSPVGLAAGAAVPPAALSTTASNAMVANVARSDERPVPAPALDIELNWQPAVGAIDAGDSSESVSVDDWTLELGVKLRSADRWKSHSHCSGELHLRCGEPDVLAPLNRLAQALHSKPKLVEGKLTARFGDTTYHLPI